MCTVNNVWIKAIRPKKKKRKQTVVEVLKATVSKPDHTLDFILF